MQTPFLIGQRIYLRPLEVEDAPLLATYINDPEVTETLMVHRPMNRQCEEEFIKKAAAGDAVILGITLKSDDRLIGAIDLRPADPRECKAELGIGIGAKEEWNKGYGSEALILILRHGFETLNLNRISLRVYEYNARAIRAYEKTGFIREGTLRQDAYRKGRYWDTIIMSVLRSEWDTRSK
jgi:[ribosomal protein S5]-alanine N-acetyltransferase